MKTYNLQKLFNTTETGERETVVFISEVNADAKGVNIPPTVNLNTNSLHYLVNYYQQQLIKADIFAVRFLKDGISVLRESRYRSTYEGNPWTQIVDDFKAKVETQHITDDPSGQIDDAFNRWAVSIKPAKFLLSLGATNAEAEQFSHDYFRTFGERPENSYTFEIIEGKAIQQAYLNGYDSGTIGSSCMGYRKRTAQVGWYAKQKGLVKLAVLKKDDGKVYARAIIWQQVTASKGDALIYSGPLADRQYYANSHAKQALINRLSELNIPRRLQDSFGECEVVNANGATIFNTASTTVKAEIKKVAQKKYPFIDTLMIVGDKYASNNVTEGDNVQANSVEGRAAYRGNWQRIDTYACAGHLENSNELAVLICPDGSVRHAYRSEATANGWVKAYEIPDAWDTPNVYVLQELTTQHNIEVKRQGRTEPRKVTVHAYPHQLAFDSESNTMKVSKLWIKGRQEFRPIESVIMYGDDMQTAIRRGRQRSN